MDSKFLFDAFILLATASVIVPFISKFRLGAVLGFLAAGILIGPFGAGLIGHAKEIMHFAEFGVVMMLFMIGMELEPAVLWRMRKAIVGLGGLQVLVTASLLAVVVAMIGFDFRSGIGIGLALALSSTALVIQILRENNLMNTDVGEKSFAVLLFQDIAVIPILVLMPLLALNPDAAGEAGAHGSMIGNLPGWVQALVVTGVIGFVVLAGRYLVHPLFGMIARTDLREVFTAASLALVVGVTLLMLAVGVSPALGAFVAGMVLANSPWKRTLETDIEPFKGLLLGLFFMSVGMGMDFSLLAKAPLAMMGTVLGLVALKVAVLLGLGWVFRIDLSQRIGLALVMSQGGEFAFVLLQYAIGLTVIEYGTAKFLTMAVAMSMATTPLLMLVYQRVIMPRFVSMLPDRDYDEVHADNPVIIAGFGRFGQVMGRFIAAQGVGITVLEKDPDQIDMIRKFGYVGFFGDASRLDMLHNAGAATAKILVVAVDNPDTCLDIVRMAHEEFPDLKIFARARNRRHAYDLHKAGASYFRREVFDSSLSMAQEVMVTLGRRESDVQYKAQKFARHDEATLKKSFAFFENEPELISFARLRRAELEQLLRDDKPEQDQDDV